MMTTRHGVLRAVALLARRADVGLADGAARNAAVGVAERGARRLEDARTMRDLARLDLADDAPSASR
jgi:hypothetical protein